MHDEGIVFEPIHRVMFGASGNRAIETILRHFKSQYSCAKVELGRMPCAQGGDTHILPFITGEVEGAFIISCPTSQLAVGTLQSALDETAKEICGCEIDYIHGADVVKELARKGGAIGFLLPALKRTSSSPRSSSTAHCRERPSPWAKRTRSVIISSVARWRRNKRKKPDTVRYLTVAGVRPATES
ncbi:MAG: hypothetical protein R2881_09560 [Eubacteriales bacterium]